MNKKKVNFLGVQIDNMTSDEIISYIDSLVEQGKPCQIVGVNVDQVLRVLNDKYSKEIFENASLVFTDGKPIMWMSKWLKRPIVEKVSGPDLMLKLCQHAAEKNQSIFLLGAGPGVAEKAAENLKKSCPGLVVSGVYSPPFGFEKDHAEMEKINKMLLESGADQLFVGMGSPKQDIFIYENMEKYQIPVSYSMGAAIDFFGGGAKRAPEWMSNMGLEWFHRFIHNPKRLFKRYFVDDMKIFGHFMRFRKEEKKAGRL